MSLRHLPKAVITLILFIYIYIYFDTQLKTGLLSLVITLFRIYFAIFSDVLPLDSEPVSIHCESLEKTAVSLFFGGLFFC